MSDLGFFFVWEGDENVDCVDHGIKNGISLLVLI